MTLFYRLPPEKPGEPPGLLKSNSSKIANAAMIQAFCEQGIFLIEIDAKEAAKIRRQLAKWEEKQIKTEHQCP